MRKILVFPGNQPCLDIEVLDIEGINKGKKFGVNRDRNPDRDWSQLRKTSLEYARKVELTPELKQILIEDLAFTYGDDSAKFSSKLQEFNLLNL